MLHKKARESEMLKDSYNFFDVSIEDKIAHIKEVVTVFKHFALPCLFLQHTALDRNDQPLRSGSYCHIALTKSPFGFMRRRLEGLL